MTNLDILYHTIHNVNHESKLMSARRAGAGMGNGEAEGI